MSTEEEFEPNSDQYSYVVNDLRNAANNPDIQMDNSKHALSLLLISETCKESDCCEGNEDYREYIILCLINMEWT
jgi:hypothetical protein